MRTCILIIMMASAAAAAEDPGGWSKAKWGMTEPQLLQVFGPEAIRLDPPEKIGTSAEDSARLLELQNQLRRVRRTRQDVTGVKKIKLFQLPK